MGDAAGSTWLRVSATEAATAAVARTSYNLGSSSSRVPRGVHRHNTFATPPGSTFTQPGLFSLTALRRTASTITIRFRWLNHNTG